jgi:endonuclease III
VSSETLGNFDALLKSLRKKHAGKDGVSAAELFEGQPLVDEPLLNEMVISMLLWESTIAHAQKAHERVREDLVDLNELRVCTSDELSTIIGTRSPRVAERSLRILTVLNTIYDRENTMSLASFREMTKREVQDYLSSIDGLPVYAAARVILFGLGWHAFPVDERIAKRLVAEDVVSAGDIEQQAAQLERGVRASDSLEVYTLVEHWAQESTRSKSKSTKKTSKGVSS